MADGSTPLTATGRMGMLTAGDARAGLGGAVWNAPGKLVEKARSWQRFSAAVFNRSAGNGHWRSEQHRFTLYLTKIGEGTVQIDNGPTQVVRAPAPFHSLGFTPAGTYITGGISRSVTLAHITQSPDTYRDLACEIAAPIGLGALEPIASFDDPEIARLIHAIVHEIDGGFLDHLLVNALNTALTVQLARRFHGSAIQLLAPGRLSRARLKRVLDYIEDHLGQSLSVTEMAAIACLSPFHFARCFKRSVGVGLHRYVVHQRIQRAKRLILQTDLPLTDIAAATGFDSQASFTERFRREVGISPGRLRRERT
jgi:AraC family transcriptional regulator